MKSHSGSGVAFLIENCGIRSGFPRELIEQETEQERRKEFYGLAVAHALFLALFNRAANNLSEI